MKKYPIGFNTRINKEPETNEPMEVCKDVIEPKKSIVQVTSLTEVWAGHITTTALI